MRVAPFVALAGSVLGILTCFRLLDVSAAAMRAVSFGIVTSLLATVILAPIAGLLVVVHDLLRKSDT